MLLDKALKCACFCMSCLIPKYSVAMLCQEFSSICRSFMLLHVCHYVFAILFLNKESRFESRTLRSFLSEKCFTIWWEFVKLSRLLITHGLKNKSLHSRVNSTQILSTLNFIFYIYYVSFYTLGTIPKWFQHFFSHFRPPSSACISKAKNS